MRPVSHESDPSAAETPSAADGIEDLAKAPHAVILAAVRAAVRDRLKGWPKGRIAGTDENDLVQHIFVALYERDRAALRRFDPKLGKATGYLWDFARKRMIELERKSLRRANLAKPNADAGSGGHHDTPEEWFEYLEKQNLLVEYLKKHASPEDQEIFYLTVVKDLTNPEAAKRKNVSPEHVANRKFAIRKRVLAFFTQLDREGGPKR